MSLSMCRPRMQTFVQPRQCPRIFSITLVNFDFNLKQKNRTQGSEMELTRE